MDHFIDLIIYKYKLKILWREQIYQKMDEEFIEEQYRDDVRRLTQICGINMEQAFKLFMDCNYNLDNAINHQFNSPTRPLNENRIIQQQMYGNSILSEFDEADHVYEVYRIFMDNEINFEKRYKGKKLKQGDQRLKKIACRNPDELTFLQKLQNLIGHHSNLKIGAKALMDAFQQCWKQRLPFVIFNINFHSSDISDMKQFFKQNNQVQKILNEQFKLIGVDIYEYKIQQSLKQLALQQKRDFLIIGRINYIDEIQIICYIKIRNDIQGMQKDIRKAKVECIRRQLDQSHIIKECNQRRKGHFQYRRPKSYKEYIKVRDDRKIREQQDKEFHQAFIPKEKNQQSNQQCGKNNNNNNIVQNSSSMDQIQKRREQTRNNLKRYDDGLCFKIRLPSGQNLLIHVDGSETVQYLFDFIESYSQKLGFIDELNRKFDLFIGLGSSDTLLDKKQQKLKTIFEHPQTLIVRELQT